VSLHRLRHTKCSPDGRGGNADLGGNECGRESFSWCVELSHEVKKKVHAKGNGEEGSSIHTPEIHSTATYVYCR